VFARLNRGEGYDILVALAGVAIFLTVEGFPALGAGAQDLPGANSFGAYVWPLLFGTLLAALVALVIATPLALGVALVISHYAPRRLATPLGYVVDLLAAVPSVVYGLWGLAFLGPRLFPVYDWLAAHVGWFPLFAGPASASGRTILTAAIVLSVSGAVMLGFGRALGETMAVTMLIGNSPQITWSLYAPQYTMAAVIANEFTEAADELYLHALVEIGLVLFAITLVINLASRMLIWSMNRPPRARRVRAAAASAAA
jgi:phosphate transport system permease protein